MLTLITVSLTLLLIVALASAEKSPPRKQDAVAGARPEAVAVGDSQSGDQRASSSTSAPCDVPCLEAKNAALQKLAVKRLRLLSAREHRIVRLMTRLHRGAKRQPAIAHLRGWLCIHNGAYPGAPHEGRGRNGPYSGVLQMTSPWMGNYAPSGSWDNLSDNAVYAIAEREFRGTGYSRSWLARQWPSTYPPCAARF